MEVIVIVSMYSFLSNMTSVLKVVFLLEYCNAATTCKGKGDCKSDGTCQCDKYYYGSSCYSKLLVIFNICKLCDEISIFYY